MKFTILPLVLLAIGAVDARPGGWGKRDDKTAAVFAKRQTTREDIANRAHVKDTVKRVHNVMDKEVEHQRKAGNFKRSPARLNARQNGNQVSVTVTSTLTDPQGVPTETTTITRDATTTIYETTTDANGQLTTTATSYAKRAGVTAAPEVQKKKRAVLEDEPELVKKDHESPPMAMLNMRPRGQYPRCDKSGAKSGYAHYPGWKLTGDDLSGGIPVTPESACVLACNKYGGACSGIYFDANLKRCYLKGVHTTAWEFEAVTSGQSTDLVGGCALWANVVPPEMDAVCCRN